jgi:hypothetical protein
MAFAWKWLELEVIMLIEVSQVQKDKVICFLSSVESRPKIYISIYNLYNLCIIY